MDHVIVTRVMELFLFNVVGSSKRLKLKRKSLCPTVKDSLNPRVKDSLRARVKDSLRARVKDSSPS